MTDTIYKDKIVVSDYWTLEDINNGRITESFIESIVRVKKGQSLEHYLKFFDITCSCMQSLVNIKAAIYDIVE